MERSHNNDGGRYLEKIVLNSIQKARRKTSGLDDPVWVGEILRTFLYSISHTRKLPYHLSYNNEEKFTAEEQTIGHGLKNKKVLGLDCVPKEVLKSSIRICPKNLLNAFKKCL